jgi:hypothetical protein
MTIWGVAGIGKSFVMNTIISYLCREFENNDKLHILLAPISTSALNNWGGGVHRCVGLEWGDLKKTCQMVL